MTGTEISIVDSIELTTGSEVRVNVDVDTVKVLDDNLATTVMTNSEYEVRPLVESVTTDYAIPESTVGTLFADMQVIRDNLAEALAGQDLAVIDQVNYILNTSEDSIRKQLTDLEVKYVGNSERFNEYVRTSELSTHTIANEYVIDRWTGHYIQNREGWVKGDDNDVHLQNRWAKTTEAEADADYPLSGLAGALAWNDNGVVVYGTEQDAADNGWKVEYRVLTTITSQDIYDKAVRVGHNQSSYTEDVRVFADNQSTYAQRTTTLEATSDETNVKLETVGGVMAGDIVYYLEDYTVDGHADPVIGVVAVFSPDGYVRTDTSTFTMEDTRLEYTATVAPAEKDGWDGWATTVKSETSVLLGSVQARVNALQNQLDQTIDSWFYEGLPYYTEEATTAELRLTSTDSLTSLRENSLVWDGVGSQMYKYVDTDTRDNVDMTTEDITDTAKYEAIWKYPESDWRSEGTVALDRHTADLYYASINGLAYRYVHEGGRYFWSQVADGALTQAMADAAAAQATADGKMSFYTGDSIPTGSTDADDIGDIWMPSADVYEEYDSGKWVLDNGVYREATQTELDDAGIQKYYRHGANEQQVFSELSAGVFMWQDDPLVSSIQSILNGTTSLDSATIGGKRLDEYVADTVATGTDNMVKVFSGTHGEEADETGMYRTDLGQGDGDLYITTDAVAATYRWSDTTNGWVEVVGATTTKALSDLSDGKKTIYYQDAAPSGTTSNPLADNDMWITGTGANAIDDSIQNSNIYVHRDGIWEDSNVLTDLQTKLDNEIDKRVQVIHSEEIPSEVDHTILQDIDTNLTIEEIAYYDLNLGDYWYCGADVGIYTAGETYEYTKAPQDVTADPVLYDYVWVKKSGTSLATIATKVKGKQSIWGGSTLPTGELKDMWIPSETVTIEEVTYTAGYTYILTTNGWSKGMAYTDDSLVNSVLEGTTELDPTKVKFGNELLSDHIQRQADKAVVLYSGITPPVLSATSTPSISVISDGDAFIAHYEVDGVTIPVSYEFVANATSEQLTLAEGEGNTVDKAYLVAITDTSVWKKLGTNTLSDLVGEVGTKAKLMSATWPNQVVGESVGDMLVLTVTNSTDPDVHIVGSAGYKPNAIGKYIKRYRIATPSDTEYVEIPDSMSADYVTKSWAYAGKANATVGARFVELTDLYIAIPIGATIDPAYEVRYDLHSDGEMLYWIPGSNSWATTADAMAQVTSHWAAGTSKFVIDEVTGAITGWSFADGSNVGSEFVVRADTFKVMGSSNGSDVTPLEVRTDAEGNSDVYFKGKVKFGNSVIDTTDNSTETVIDGGDIKTGSISSTTKVVDPASGLTHGITEFDINSGALVIRDANGTIRVRLGKLS